MRIIVLFFLLVSSSVYSQDSIVARQETRRYISIQSFRETGKELTKKDSLNFRFHNGDTLVLLETGVLDYQDEQKVRVPYEPKDEDFLKIYKQAVFGPDEDEGKKSTIKIWKEGIRLFFDPSVPSNHRKELLRFASKVSSGIDSLRITEVQNRAQSNFLVFYRNTEKDFDQEQRIPNTSKASYYLSWNGKQQIYRGVIKVNSYMISSSNHELELLKYHFFKALGHFSYSPELPCKSYLSECPVKRKLTKQDLEILAYHYSYGICKGIDRKSFEDIHRKYEALMNEHPNSQFFMIHTN